MVYISKCSPELSTLRETHDVESILEIVVLSQVLADDVNLLIDVLEEAIEHVFFNVLTDHDGTHVNTRDLFTHHLHQVTHAEGEATAVTWREEGGGGGGGGGERERGELVDRK